MNGNMNRKEAREQAFILIFEKSFHDQPVPEMIEAAKEGRELKPNAYMEQAVSGVFSHLDEIDDDIRKYLTGWKLERISRVSLAVLRLAMFEILYMDEIPVSVSINEAVELCKRFATKEDAAYVNGVLGTAVRSLGLDAENESPKAEEPIA